MSGLITDNASFVTDDDLSTVRPSRGAASKPKLGGRAPRGKSPAPWTVTEATETTDAYYATEFVMADGSPAREPLVTWAPPEAVQQALHDAALVKPYQEMGASIASSEQANPDALRRFLKGDVERWKAAMKNAGIAPE